MKITVRLPEGCAWVECECTKCFILWIQLVGAVVILPRLREHPLADGEISEQRPGHEVARFARQGSVECRGRGRGLIEASERGGLDVVALGRVRVDVERAIYLLQRRRRLAIEQALCAGTVVVGETLAGEAGASDDQRHQQRGGAQRHDSPGYGRRS